MITDERTSRQEALETAVLSVMTAGRTAPKGRGGDLIEIVALTGGEIHALADTMRRAHEENKLDFFLRDADSIEQAGAVILVGTSHSPMGLDCGYCGFSSCTAKEKLSAVPCALNTSDVGIAVGSMVSRAADMRTDTRVMYSAGSVAHRMGVLAHCRTVLAIPLSISSKNPFFDRKPKEAK